MDPRDLARARGAEPLARAAPEYERLRRGAAGPRGEWLQEPRLLGGRGEAALAVPLAEMAGHRAAAAAAGDPPAYVFNLLTRREQHRHAALVSNSVPPRRPAAPH